VFHIPAPFTFYAFRFTFSAVRQRLYHYLFERPGGASPRELLDLVFTQPGSDPEFGPRFLRGLLDADPRFVWRAADGTWGVRAHDALAGTLDEATFVVCDVETTGMAASATGIIEIGAARVRGGRIVAEFEQLVDPGVRLPPFITQLTGITDAMLAGQPRMAAAWPRFTDFLGDDVLVAHNARFDLGFLNAAALAHDGRAIANPTLCTLQLARRLLPGLRRRGLDALAAHFAIPQADRHRALGDVRITVEVLFALLELLAARGVVRLDQLLDLQHHARDGRRFVCPLPRDRVQQLPTQPGVYEFYDATGRLLYIGKGKNLRERVQSYLANSAGHSDKTLDLIRHVHDVRTRQAGSELEAALEEAEAIRRHQPPYNRLGKHLPRIAFLKLSVADAFPRLSLARSPSSRRARYIGPFHSREEAERVLNLLTRLFQVRTCAGKLQPATDVAPCLQGQIGACTAPCAARVPAAAYREQVNACLDLLSGDAASTEERLALRRDELAEMMRFEAAAKLQRDLRLLRMLQRRQRTLGWLTAEQHFLVLQPSADRSVVLAYAVLAGRLALRARLSGAEQIDHLAAQVCERLPLAARQSLRADEVDGTTIVAAWLRDRGESDGYVLRIAETPQPAILAEEWRAVCATLLSAGTGA
jgi:DNA polymerase-3 subunit epsilon